MNRDPIDIRGRLNLIFQEVFDDDELVVHDDMTAADVEEWDSLSHITLVVAVEGEFGLRLAPAEIGQLNNVGEMIKVLAERATK